MVSVHTYRNGNKYIKKYRQISVHIHGDGYDIESISDAAPPLSSATPSIVFLIVVYTSPDSVSVAGCWEGSYCILIFTLYIQIMTIIHVVP
jgi:hypothetical protein